jgi:hypothetical protein
MVRYLGDNGVHRIQFIARIEQLKSLTPVIKILVGDKPRGKKTNFPSQFKQLGITARAVTVYNDVD